MNILAKAREKVWHAEWWLSSSNGYLPSRLSSIMQIILSIRIFGYLTWHLSNEIKYVPERTWSIRSFISQLGNNLNGWSNRRQQSARSATEKLSSLPWMSETKDTMSFGFTGQSEAAMHQMSAFEATMRLWATASRQDWDDWRSLSTSYQSCGNQWSVECAFNPSCCNPIDHYQYRSDRSYQHFAKSLVYVQTMSERTLDTPTSRATAIIVGPERVFNRKCGIDHITSQFLHPCSPSVAVDQWRVDVSATTPVFSHPRASSLHHCLIYSRTIRLVDNPDFPTGIFGYF